MPDDWTLRYVALPRKRQWILKKILVVWDFVFMALLAVCVRRISKFFFHVSLTNSRLARDQFNAQTHSLKCGLFLFWSHSSTRFWRFKKGLRIIWSYKKNMSKDKTFWFENISRLNSFLHPSMKMLKINFFNHCLSVVRISIDEKRKTCFWCGFGFHFILFLFYSFTIAHFKWNVILGLLN